jgi:hypothetical protein
VLRWKRTIRTASSERFVAVRDDQEVGSADLHYLADGSVLGTIVLFREAEWSEEQIPDMLASLDEDLLPSVDAAEGNVRFTVVIGDMIGESSRDDREE